MEFDLDMALEIGLGLSAALILGLCAFLVFRTMVLPDPDAIKVAPKTEAKKKA
jgi:hypothetical protein